MNMNNGVKWRRFIVPKKVEQINESGGFSYTLALDRRSTCRQAGTVCNRFVEQSAANGAP